MKPEGCIDMFEAKEFKTSGNNFSFKIEDRLFVFKAENNFETDEWIRCLNIIREVNRI